MNQDKSFLIPHNLPYTFEYREGGKLLFFLAFLYSFPLFPIKSKKYLYKDKEDKVAEKVLK